MKRPERTKPHADGSCYWAALYLFAAVLWAWRSALLWNDDSPWWRCIMGLLAIVSLAWFFDEIRKLVRAEIARARFAQDLREQLWNPRERR
jgi:hypothetical protein